MPYDERINPEKQWVRPSSFGTGGTTRPPVRNVRRPGAGGARTGGIVDRVMKAKPYHPLRRFKGKGQIIKERFEQRQEQPRRMRGSQRPMLPAQQFQTQPQMQLQMMPSIVGTPIQPFMPQQQFIPQQQFMPQPMMYPQRYMMPYRGY